MNLKKVILIIIISAGTMTIITGLLPFKKKTPEFKQATENNLPNILQITMEGEDEDTNSWGIAETGIKMMERLSGKADPRLMEFHFYRPVSYQPLKKYADRYEPSEIPLPESFYDSYSNKPNIYKRDRETYNEATEQDCRNGRAAYYAQQIMDK